MPEPSILRSHPPTRERIRRLEELAGGVPVTPFRAAEDFGLPAGFGVPHEPRWRWPGVWF